MSFEAFEDLPILETFQEENDEIQKLITQRIDIPYKLSQVKYNLENAYKMHNQFIQEIHTKMKMKQRNDINTYFNFFSNIAYIKRQKNEREDLEKQMDDIENILYDKMEKYILTVYDVLDQ